MGVRGGRVYNKQGTNDVFRDENATSKVRMVSTMSNRSKSRIVVFNKNKSSLFPFLSQMHQCLQ